jgi:hypothetical protein
MSTAPSSALLNSSGKTLIGSEDVQGLPIMIAPDRPQPPPISTPTKSLKIANTTGGRLHSWAGDGLNVDCALFAGVQHGKGVTNIVRVMNTLEGAEMDNETDPSAT